MLRFEIVTLFPEMFDAFCRTSMVGRAVANALIEVNTIDLRDYGLGKHRHVDDYPYGGGAGMVMRPEPLSDALDTLLGERDEKPCVVYFSPKGEPLTQEIARRLYADHTCYVLLCGHYEGMDQRVIDAYVDREISIGDYVLTGGELPAMVLDRLYEPAGARSLGQRAFHRGGVLRGRAAWSIPSTRVPAEYRDKRRSRRYCYRGTMPGSRHGGSGRRMRLTYERRPELIRERKT